MSDVDEFSASAAGPTAGLEGDRVVPLTVAAPAVKGTRSAPVLARDVHPGDWVIPKYGTPYQVEAVYRRQGGMVQIRSVEGKTKSWCLDDTKVWVRR